VNVSIVVPAHNEAANIEGLLRSLMSQSLGRARVVELVVVASGCTDETASIARRVLAGDPSLHVKVEERRTGKVAAINAYLKTRDPRAQIVVLCSADLCVAPDVIEQMVECFASQPKIGMVGVRPVPDNDPSKLVGRMVTVLWEMHHRVCMRTPKMGELVAFRADLVERVSELSIVDEASIEDIILSRGYELGYLPDAVVTNHGPETVGELFEQRRRIARGHYWLDFAFGYKVATLEPGMLIETAQAVARDEDTFGRAALAANAVVEVLARAAGFFDARVLGGKHRTWKQLVSTKKALRTSAKDGSPSSPGATRPDAEG
jgi:cellulose synthase/poly-beta-1,6-N-acetylglucosamine synthase-like glycosyltransferase